MIASVFAMAMVTPQAQNRYEPPMSQQVIMRPLESATERKARLDLISKQIDKEVKAGEQLKSKKNRIKEKIKAENEKINQLKSEIAAKLEAERIAAEQAAQQAAAQQAAVSQVQYQSPATAAPQQAVHAPAARQVSLGGSNTYAWGYCTWYIKNVRPEIGGFWGNANQWIGSAQASGFATGSEPRIGAIGVSFAGAYGHVVYVTGVSADGSTITFSEMNGSGGLGVITTRSDSAHSYQYIY